MIQQILVCRDEIRRIVFLAKKKKKLFENLLLDARAFEDGKKKQWAKHRKQERATSENSETPEAEEGMESSKKLRTAVDMAEWSIRRTETELEGFEGINEEVCMLLEEVSYTWSTSRSQEFHK